MVSSLLLLGLFGRRGGVEDWNRVIMHWIGGIDGDSFDDDSDGNDVDVVDDDLANLYKAALMCRCVDGNCIILD